jgi:preprotein translocase subunit SecB
MFKLLVHVTQENNKQNMFKLLVHVTQEHTKQNMFQLIVHVSSWNMFCLLCLLLHVQVAGTCSVYCVPVLHAQVA